ncbi:hypothetical protein BSIN_4783 [Burkholderia singularis]|uniref:Uncharacterized protein n=1 Tax=Burkholderia singularis TaxID=1503053 RepID=A0A238HAG2_9BURK|nr:hypothetical protein BSIN_4783 [Burkholderia singularis]
MPRCADVRRFTPFAPSRFHITRRFAFSAKRRFFQTRCFERLPAVIAPADKRSEFASLTRTPRRH